MAPAAPETRFLDTRASRAWVGLFEPGPEAFGGDVGIDLRRRERGMAEVFLDGAQVGAALDEVRGGTVSQSVRRQRRRAVDGRCRAVDEFPDLSLIHI